MLKKIILKRIFFFICLYQTRSTFLSLVLDTKLLCLTKSRSLLSLIKCFRTPLCFLIEEKKSVEIQVNLNGNLLIRTYWHSKYLKKLIYLFLCPNFSDCFSFYNKISDFDKSCQQVTKNFCFSRNIIIFDIQNIKHFVFHT